MKILFFSHQADFIYGGEVVTLAFMRELRSLGVEVHFASPPGPYFERAEEVAQFIHAVSSVQFKREISGLPKLGAAMLSTNRELSSLVSEHGIDLVHATSLKAMAYTWALGKGTPVIWHHHDILPLSLANSLWVRGLAARAKRILAPSAATRNSLLGEGLGEDKVFVLHNGFRVSEWKARPAPHGPLFRVGLVGEISPRKGTDRLEGILRELGHPADFQFLVIGEGLSDPSYAAGLKARLASKQVRFLGKRTRMKELYQEMDVLLVPSRQDPLPTVIVEAGLSGVPVVGARAGGIPEMIEDGRNGYLFENERQAASRLNKVRGHWPVLSAGAREIAVERYDIQKLAKDLIGHYKEAMGDA